MATVYHDLGAASSVTPDAIGEPGKRQFRLIAQGPGGSATMWLEKQQLQELALAIHRLLGAHFERRGGALLSPPDPTTPPKDLDFQAGNISLEYEEDSQTIQIEAQDLDGEAEGPSMVRILTTREQSEQLADEALEICAAGRPLCPLCYAPLNEGEDHICPMANGHHKELGH